MMVKKGLFNPLWLYCCGLLLLGAGCQPGNSPGLSRVCQSNGICLEPDGTRVYADGTPVPCALGGNCDDELSQTQTGQNTADNNSTTTSTGNTPIEVLQPKQGDCRPSNGFAYDPNDQDGDCIPDALELLHGNSDPNKYDTDGDGLGDGFEDWNHDGVYQVGLETDPNNMDTDGDGLFDGYNPDNTVDPNNAGEDRNNNGVQDAGETSPIKADTDGDGIPDGTEDRNHNGIVDAWIDMDGDGCFDPDFDIAGETNPLQIDTDGDGILDGIEDRNHNGQYDPTLGETVAFFKDTDCDGLSDGKEDLNRNGYVDAGETDPRLADSDGDGLCDGYSTARLANPNHYEPVCTGWEDRNNNGRVDLGETSPILSDSDGDGIPDGVEDRNRNGRVDQWVDSNGNGCWDAGETAGESDPRLWDTDADGIPDNLEDQNHDGICNTAMRHDPLNPDPNSALKRNFVETCAWLKDTDCDGLPDGTEDINRNGSRDTGETDPRQSDSDLDGLMDGCPAINPPYGCEDKNNNGIVDAGETSPLLADTDGDGLSDGCELKFGPHPPAGGTDPLNEDTDGDGVTDGDEDANHNCITDNNETDPRVYDAPPASGDPNYPKYSVCGTENLKNLTYVADARSTVDARVAFEVERQAVGNCGTQGCATGQLCINQKCVKQASYITASYGKNKTGASFSEQDWNDILRGWVFQSPVGVVKDSVTQATLNRDIYGFVYVDEDDRGLDDVLDSMRTMLETRYSTQATITEIGNLTERTAFDSSTHFRTRFAQRQFSVSFFKANAYSALGLRNDVLVGGYLGNQTPDPSTAVPTTDPVYGAISCPGSAYCYTNFTLYIGSVQRLDQKGLTGEPVVVTVVALTPNDSSTSDATAAQNRFYADRLTRLSDLTGGSAVARYAASVGKACDPMDPTQAVADLLWVIDDSRSMQQMISRIQQASEAAQATLTSNAGIVDFRVGMTTTNAAKTARTLCPSYCTGDGIGINSNGNWRASDCDVTAVDQTLGCIKICNASCNKTGCSNGICTCSNANPNNCSGSATAGVDCNVGKCLDTNSATVLAAALLADANSPLSNPNSLNQNQLWMPGGGGSFYYEDTLLWDCDSSNILSGQQYNLPDAQLPYLNLCTSSFKGKSYYTGNIPSFFGGAARKRLLKNAGMLGSYANASSDANCNTLALDLRYSTSTATAPSDLACAVSGSCCQHLINECQDGPTVLASQMCDIIRAMGGLPGTSNGATTSSARRHSGPEHGSRSARRLLQSMLPALPLDYNQATDANHYDPSKHLRLNCNTSPTCKVCNPIQDSNCVPIPLATVFLSDEEDFYFKDDCMPDQKNADKRQLPEDCYYLDGDATTAESCSAPAGSSYNPNGTTPLAYCQAVVKAGWPTGSNPDRASWTSDAQFSLQWRDSNAAECSGSDACVVDACETYSDPNACRADPACIANSDGVCIDAYCAQYTSSNTPGSQTAATNEQLRCAADARCRWDASQVRYNSSQQGACLPKVPPNDCAACKRLLRLNESLSGDSNLIGFATTGPVYAVVRDKGEAGYGGVFASSTDDSCHGGAVTWGRGDGQGYRDLAINTLGRTQDVCASSYQNFVALLVSDLAVLSKPYPLTGDPIAATIKVGLARPNGQGALDYIEVPRSMTSGFFYDATGNSIGFKSDPVDGQCGTLAGGCSANGVIEQNEILYAQTASFIPQTGDTVYVSYRLWKNIPCNGACLSNQVCATVTCTTPTASYSCPAADASNPAMDPNGYCPPGMTCQSQACVMNCTPGDLVEGCVNQAACGPCESYDESTQLCLPINDGCTCNATGATGCIPGAVNSCSVGYSCSDQCACEKTLGCGSAVFGSNGQVSDCASALACCQAFATNANTNNPVCLTHTTESTCKQDTSHNCIWKYDAAGNYCGYREETCCSSTESIRCYTDPEGQGSTLYCAPSACTCSCPKGYECDPSAPRPSASDPNCACYYNGG